MVLEYLIETKDKVQKAKSLVDESELTFSMSILSENRFIVVIGFNGESERAAKKLSDINDLIFEFDSPIVLSNGAASYFNKILYPLVNDFERKLRKLLYAASALKPSENDVISNLEEKDFGEIFDILFLDNDFLIRVKSFVNGNKKTGKNWNGYSYELKSFLANESENILWDRLLPGQVPSLRGRFAEIRLRRNDIMHAHNINKNEFFNTRKLFKTVNQELDNAIEGLADGALIPNTYNNDIENAFFLATENGEIITTEQGIPIICEIRR